MISNFMGDVPMFECRAQERIAINQLGLLHVDGIRGCHPCLVENFHSDGARLHSPTYHTAAFRFDLSLCIVAWCGGTEIPAASNLSIIAMFAQGALLGRAARRRQVREAGARRRGFVRVTSNIVAFTTKPFPESSINRLGWNFHGYSTLSLYRGYF